MVFIPQKMYALLLSVVALNYTCKTISMISKKFVLVVGSERKTRVYVNKFYIEIIIGISASHKF